MHKQSRRLSRMVEALERRQLLAAHINGNPAVFATIQAAVNAAAPGATITVDAGTYAELVTVNKTLTITGAKAGIDGADSSRGSGESIVRGFEVTPGKRSSGFYITANGVTVDGFTVQENSSTGTLGAGVVLAPSINGTHIYNNVIQNNIAGLFLANASPINAAVIQHNLFKSNNNPGPNNGRGIYTDGSVSGGLLNGVIIDSNTFVNNVGDGTVAPNAEAAIGLEAQGAGKQFNITITNNVMQNNGKGILLLNTTGVSIMHNVISGCTDAISAAIRLEGGNSNVTIQCNNLTQNSGAGVRLSPRFGGPDAAVFINENNIVGNAGGGLIVDPGGYVGTLDATFNYWGSASGPSGNAPGTGDSVIAGGGTSIAVNPFLTEASDCAPAINQAPRDLLQGVIKDITTLRNSNSGDTGKKLQETVDKLWEANSDSRWLDKNHLSRKGEDFFDRIRDSIKRLRDLQKNKKSAVPSSVLQDAIDRLIAMTQSLLDIALFDASAGNPKKFAEAQKELDRAQNALDDNKIDEVFDHLKKAWKKTQDALK